MSKTITFKCGENSPFKVRVLETMNEIQLNDLKSTIAKLAGGTTSDDFDIKKGEETLPLTTVYEAEDGQTLVVIFRASEIDLNNNFHPNGQLCKLYAEKKANILRHNLAQLGDQRFTIVKRNLICTYQHGSHSLWKVNDIVEGIRLFNDEVISCTVLCCRSDMDCIWLKPNGELPPEIVDISISIPKLGQEIIILGLSGLSQTSDKISYDIGNISCESIDENFLQRTNKKSASGDSGGPIFDYFTGELVGMMVGVETFENKTNKGNSSGCFPGFSNSIKWKSMAAAGGYGGKEQIVGSYYLIAPQYLN